MRVYIILVDNSVSYEGYVTVNNARDFIKHRSDGPRQVDLWRYESDKHTYLIKEINVK